MTKSLILFLFALNLQAMDSRTPGAKPVKPIPDVTESVSKVDLFAQKNTFDQIFSDRNFIEKFERLTTALDAQWPSISADLTSRLSKEVDRYNISTVFGLEGNAVKLLGSTVADIELNTSKFAIVADLYYRIEIRPSFRDGKQLRKDIYVIGLRGSNVISAGSEVRVTFFREFDSKVDAVLAGRPYGLSQIPRNADDVVNKLKVQDGVRIEGFANLQISDAVSKLTKSANLSAILGYDLFQGLFMLDIHKYSVADVRARFMGTINRGTLKASVGLNWLSKYNVNGIMSKIFRDIFDVSFNINISKSLNFFNEHPIETHIADYFFRFNSGTSSNASITQNCNFQSPADINSNRPLTSEEAFNELIGNVRSGQFISLFNPNLKEATLSAAILKNASIAETLACQDQNLPSEKRRVLHFFKGRMAADIFSLDFGPRISRLIKKTVTEGHSEVFVASVEQNQDLKYYLLLNSYSKNNNSYAFGRWENEYISDLDALYLSDKNKSVVNFLDFVKRIQYKDKNWSLPNLKEIYSDINRSVPPNFPDRERLLDLIPKTEQRDGLISLVYTLSDKVVQAIEKTEKGMLYKSLSNYLEKHPKRYLMNIPPDYPGEGSAGNLGTFTEYVNHLYFQIIKFANSQEKPEERFLALRELMRTKAFTDYIFTEFLPTLIESEVAGDAMSVQMSLSTADIALSELRIGRNQYSGVYSAVLLLRSMLNDRSLDLRLESVTTESEASSENSMKIQGFKIL